MSVAVLNTFCRNFQYTYVEEWQKGGEPIYCFLDFQGQRLRFTADEIRRRLRGG